jgi:hypothetical protein
LGNLGGTFENVDVGMQLSFVEEGGEERKQVLSDNDLIGVDFEYVLNETSNGEVDFALNGELIHFGPDLDVVRLGEVGVENVDSDSEGFVGSRRFATHVG